MIKDKLVEKGPLSVSMGMAGSFDGSGIYRCTDDSIVNHAVVIAGYSNAGGYWIVKNSWGSSWNGDGYFKVGYGECSIENYVYYASLEPSGGTISGVVTSAGGSAIVGAGVTACPWEDGDCDEASTGPDGTYTFRGMAPGSYRVEACATGYICEYYNGHLAWEDADPVPVTEGANTANINFSLRVEGTISGRVTKPGGNPVVGGSLSACPFASGNCSWDTTASDGSYTIGGLATGDYRVQACATGYVCEYWDDHVAWEEADPVVVTEGTDTPGINFSLRVGGTISGVVTDEGGSPIQGCWVTAGPHSGSGTWASGQTGADGAYTIGGLATGFYRVEAPCTGYVREYWDDHVAYEDADPVPVTEGADTAGINFSLRLGGTISGVVSNADGEPIEGCWVSADSYAGSGASGGGYTGPDGAYTTAALPTGSYRLWASCTGYVREYWDDHVAYEDADPVAVTEGQDTAGINFSLRLGGTISGVVTHAGGSPIEGAELSASPYTGGGTYGWATTGPDGSYSMGSLATGSYRVRAECTGYFTEYWDDHVAWEDADPVAVTEGANTSDINFSLRVGGSISGVVTDPAGNPIEGASLSADPYTGGGTYGWATTGPDGSYSIGGLATGEYRVNACAESYVCECWDDHVAWEDADPVAVTEGSETPNINFSLSAWSTISGVVTDAGGNPIADASLTADPYTGGGQSGSGYTGPDGTYTIAYLARGSYRVRACAGGYVCENYDDHLTWWLDSSPVADPVQVTEGANTPDINFSLRVEGTISGAVTDLLGSPITGAFVAVGASPLTGQVTGGFAFPAPDGTYTIGRLATGSYRVEACASGYACEYWDDRPSEQAGDPVAVTGGSNTPGINFALQTDPDNDGVRNDVDNCPSVPNPGQENTDAAIGNGPGIPGDDTTVPNAVADSEGDACETDGDADNDGLPDASDSDPGGDITYDDNNNGIMCPTDAADDGPSWDSNCNGKRDGVEGSCPLTVNPNGDDDGDGLLNTWEVCKWGTSATVINTDGDTLGDCTEVMDVNGNGLLTAADGTFIMQAFFDLIGKDGDFDINGNRLITPADAVFVLQAFFGVRPCY